MYVDNFPFYNFNSYEYYANNNKKTMSWLLLLCTSVPIPIWCVCLVSPLSSFSHMHIFTMDPRFYCGTEDLCTVSTEAETRFVLIFLFALRIKGFKHWLWFYMRFCRYPSAWNTVRSLNEYILVRGLLGLKYVTPKSHMLKSLLTVTLNITMFGDRVLKERIEVKWGHWSRS